MVLYWLPRQFLWKTHKRPRKRPSLTTSISTIKSAFMHLVLLLSGQLLLIPGPTTPDQASTFCSNDPCGRSLKKVKDSQHALLCDKCEPWFHTECLDYSVSNYSTLLNFTSSTWVCTDCGYSNYLHRTPNIYQILSCTNFNSILFDCSDDDNDLPKYRFLSFYSSQR